MSKSIVLKMRNTRLSRTSIVFLGSKCMSSTTSYRVVEGVKQNRFPTSHSPWSALSCNHFSSSAGSDDKKEEPDTETYLQKWIRAFNETTTLHPDLSLYSFLIMRIATWYMLAGVGTMVLDLGPELAVGYLAARFTGNFRQPFNLGLAALISAEYPIFSTIKSSALMGIITQAPSKVEKPPQVVKFEKFIKRISGPIDKYGFSYFVASRINLAILICGVSYGVQTGLDVPEMLTYMGVGETIQSGAGAMGFATLFNVFLTPLHLAAFPLVLPYVVHQKNRMGQSMEIMSDIYDKRNKDK